jgi:hypothetical protein
MSAFQRVSAVQTVDPALLMPATLVQAPDTPAQLHGSAWRATAFRELGALNEDIIHGRGTAHSRFLVRIHHLEHANLSQSLLQGGCQLFVAQGEDVR